MTTTKKRTVKLKASTRTTTTNMVPPVEGRHKNVWRSSGECAHQWAAQHYPSGRAGNTSWWNGEFKSYATVVARFVRTLDAKGSPDRWGVFVTTQRYSVTTACHMSDVHGAIPGRFVTFHVYDVMADTVEAHRANFMDYVDRAVSKVEESKRSRKYKDLLKAAAAGLIEEANRYAEFVGIPDRSAEITLEEAERLRAAAAAEKAAEQKRRTAEQKKKDAAAAKEYAEKKAAWLAGAEGERFLRCPGSHPDWNRTFLRVKRTTGGRPATLETSRGARVPFEAAAALVPIIRAGGKPPDGMMVAEFMVDGIDHDAKTVTVGCHVVEFAEVERIAAECGL